MFDRFSQITPQILVVEMVEMPPLFEYLSGGKSFMATSEIPSKHPAPQVTVASYFVSHLENAGGGALELGTVAKVRERARHH
jgi:hypothetical protein